MVILGTICHYFSKTSLINRLLGESSAAYVLRCFSAKRSCQQIFSFRQFEKYKALDGMKCFLSFWVLLVHTMGAGAALLHIRNFYLSSVYKLAFNWRNFFFSNPLLMDNFMLISGLYLLIVIKWLIIFIDYIIFSYSVVQHFIVKVRAKQRKIQLYTIYYI